MLTTKQGTWNEMKRYFTNIPLVSEDMWLLLHKSVGSRFQALAVGRLPGLLGSCLRKVIWGLCENGGMPKSCNGKNIWLDTYAPNIDIENLWKWSFKVGDAAEDQLPEFAAQNSLVFTCHLLLRGVYIIYVYVYVCVYIYIYLYIRGKGRERCIYVYIIISDKPVYFIRIVKYMRTHHTYIHKYIYIHISIYIYIYTYIYTYIYIYTCMKVLENWLIDGFGVTQVFETSIFFVPGDLALKLARTKSYLRIHLKARFALWWHSILLNPVPSQLVITRCRSGYSTWDRIGKDKIDR